LIPARFPARFATAALTLALVCAPAAARAQDYPRLGLYCSMYGDGFPLWDVNGALQDSALAAIARYHQVVLDASPITPYRPDAAAALRVRHPGIKLCAYVTGHNIWGANNADSTIHYPTRYNHLVRSLGGYLYDTAGRLFDGSDVNLAKRDANGRFIVAESLADLFMNAIVTTGIWDGMFLDVYCKSILWMEGPGVQIDYVRAGYPSLSAFDQAWGAGVDTLGNRLKRLAGPSFELIGNCGQSTNYGWFNGWMRENFPYQNGGDWYQNMYRIPGGYFVDDARFLPPQSNYLFSALVASDPYDPNNARKARLGLASAALGKGYSVFGPSDRRSRPFPYHMWWYDEYGVDLATGGASGLIQHTGWLGQPLGDYYQMIWIGTNPDVVTNSDFETDVTSGWRFSAGVPATLMRDVGTAAVGSASARVTVSAAGSVSWAVGFGTVGTMPLSAGQPYSASFWARASAPRTIVVAAGPTASLRIAITTSWKRYQVTLLPYADGNAGLQLFLAEAAGDVWFDDVHFQPGVTNLYRRDFQNGIVLVNPSNDVLTVPLEHLYRKIRGVSDPATNDGTIVALVTVNPSDALFLIGDDRIPPAAIMDLQTGSAWQPHLRARRPQAGGGSSQPPPPHDP